jgi:hypothetical protein
MHTHQTEVCVGLSRSFLVDVVNRGRYPAIVVQELIPRDLAVLVSLLLKRLEKILQHVLSGPLAVHKFGVPSHVVHLFQITVGEDTRVVGVKLLERLRCKTVGVCVRKTNCASKGGGGSSLITIATDDRTRPERLCHQRKRAPETDEERDDPTTVATPQIRAGRQNSRKKRGRSGWLTFLIRLTRSFDSGGRSLRMNSSKSIEPEPSSSKISKACLYSFALS